MSFLLTSHFSVRLKVMTSGATGLYCFCAQMVEFGVLRERVVTRFQSTDNDCVCANYFFRFFFDSIKALIWHSALHAHVKLAFVWSAPFNSPIILYTIAKCFVCVRPKCLAVHVHRLC